MSCNKRCEFPDISEESLNKFYESVFGNQNKNHFIDKPDRFVLEEDISHQEDINDQLNLLIEDILDDPDLLDADDIVNTLSGIVAVHTLRTNKLWQHFKMIYELDEYSPQRQEKKCKGACKSGSCSYNQEKD